MSKNAETQEKLERSSKKHCSISYAGIKSRGTRPEVKEPVLKKCLKFTENHM